MSRRVTRVGDQKYLKITLSIAVSATMSTKILLKWIVSAEFAARGSSVSIVNIAQYDTKMVIMILISDVMTGIVRTVRARVLDAWNRRR